MRPSNPHGPHEGTKTEERMAHTVVVDGEGRATGVRYVEEEQRARPRPSSLAHP